MVEERVVGNLEEPRAEPPPVLIARRREVGLHQGILCQVIGIVFVAAAEGEHEAPQGLLLTLHMADEYFACHGLRLFCQFSLLCLNLFGEDFLAYEIIEKKGNAHCQKDYTDIQAIIGPTIGGN